MVGSFHCAIRAIQLKKEFDRNYAIIYLANPNGDAKMTLRDRPTTKKPAYLAGFLGFFWAAFLCGSGGVLSILRSTSSGRGIGLASGFFMAGL
jgi:hypothetical protein